MGILSAPTGIPSVPTTLPGQFGSSSYNSNVSGIKTTVPTVSTNNTGLINNGNSQSSLYTTKPNPVFTPSNTAATNPAPTKATTPVKTSLSSPAAATYVQNKVTAGANQPGLYDANTGLTANGLTPQQVAAGYSTIQGGFDPVTGKPIGGGTGVSTNGNTGTAQTNTTTANPNVVQVDPTTGQPLNQTPAEAAFQTYLQSLQPNAAVTNAQQKLNDYQSAATKEQATIGAQPILSSFATGQEQVAAKNEQATIANLEGNVSIAQNAQQQVQNASKAGLDFQQQQQQLAQTAALALKPTALAAGSQVYDPKTGQIISNNGTGSSGGTTLSPSATNFIAQVSASGVNLDSLLPALGNGGAGSVAKQQILNDIATNAQKLGIDGATFGAMLTDSRAKTATYTALQKQGSQTKVNEDTAIKNFNQLEGLAQKVASDPSLIQSSIPVLQNWLLKGQLALTGNANVNNFMGTLTTALTEYAKVVSGATTGAAVTDSANGAAQQLLNAGLSPAAIQSFVTNATKEMANRTSSYDDALKGLFGNIQSLSDTSGGLGTSSSSGSGSIYDF